MTLDVSFTAVGPPALDALREVVVEAKAGDALRLVTVAVPSGVAGLSARRALSRSGVPGAGSGVAAVSFSPLVRIAELLGAPGLANGGARPVTPTVALAAVRAELRARVGAWSSVATHPATERAMGATVADLRAGPPQALDDLAAMGGTPGSVAHLARRVGERLRGWYDERDLYQAATEAAANAATITGPVIVWLPPLPLADRVGSFLHALSAVVPVRVVLGLTGATEADGPALATADLLAGASAPGRGSVVLPDATEILAAPDTDEEARAITRRVAGWFAEGVPLHRMAVFHPAGAGPALVLHEHLRAAGLPATGPDPRRLRDALVPRVLFELLALPDGDFARDDVIGLLAAAPVLRADETPVPFTRWDTLSREAGVVRGLAQWRSKLTDLSAARAARRRELEELGEASPAWIDRLVRDEEEAGALLEFVDDLARRLDQPPPDSWAQLAEWCRELLKRFLGGASRRAHWPERELVAGEQLDQVLQMLGPLDEVSADGALPPRLDSLRRLLEVELDRPAGRVGRFGEGVLVAPFEAAAGLDLDRVVVMGLHEGGWPHRPGDDPLLPDRTRAVVGVAARGVSVPEQHRRYLVALAAGREVRIASYPAADLRSGRRFEPSRWLGDPDGSTPPTDGAVEERRVERSESFAAGLRSGAAPAGAADLDLRLLVSWRDGGALITEAPVVRDRPDLAAGLHLRAERARRGFTRFDGNIAEGIAASHLEERLLSPTSLERYAGCPFKYLLTTVLRVGAIDRPEELDEISALDRGSLVHEVLERFVAAVLERPDGDQPQPDQPWTDADHDRLDELFDEVAGRYESEGRTGRWLRWQHEKAGVRRRLHAFLSRDDEYRREQGTRPVAVEMAFGNEGEAPVEIRVGDRVLRFHGQADRVDRTADGGVVVLDYKTNRPVYFRALIDGDPVQRGQRLQLPIYALAAQQNFAGRGEPRAGYVFIHDDAPVGLVGYAVDERRLHRFEETVGVLVDGITSGAFPPNPGPYESFWGTHSNCRFCDYDRLCPPTRGEQWDTVVDAPQLRDYVDLVEGPDPWDDEVDDEEVEEGS